MEIVVRKAKDGDLQSILDLYRAPDMDDTDIAPIEDAKKIFQKMKRYPFFYVYVAEFGDEIVGTFELLVMDNLAHKGAPSGVVEDVVVSEKHRGKGIGKKMMRYAMDRCKELGCYKLSLSSNLKREQAHGFYESLGFKRHGYSFMIEI